MTLEDLLLCKGSSLGSCKTWHLPYRRKSLSSTNKSMNQMIKILYLWCWRRRSRQWFLNLKAIWTKMPSMKKSGITYTCYNTWDIVDRSKDAKVIWCRTVLRSKFLVLENQIRSSFTILKGWIITNSYYDNKKTWGTLPKVLRDVQPIHYSSLFLCSWTKRYLIASQCLLLSEIRKPCVPLHLKIRVTTVNIW